MLADTNGIITLFGSSKKRADHSRTTQADKHAVTGCENARRRLEFFEGGYSEEDVFQYVAGLFGVFHAEEFPGLSDEEVEVFGVVVLALVGELRESQLGRQEGVVEVEEFERRGRQVLQGGGIQGGLEFREGEIELGLNEGEWFVVFCILYFVK